MIVASSSSDIRFMIRPANAPMRTNYTLGIQGGDIRVGDMISVSGNSGTAPTQSGYENGEYGQGGGQGGYSGLTQYRVYRHEPNSTNPGMFTLDAEL
jgi:subtilase family serine protease